jgi:hypothetical protein
MKHSIEKTNPIEDANKDLLMIRLFHFVQGEAKGNFAISALVVLALILAFIFWDLYPH